MLVGGKVDLVAGARADPPTARHRFSLVLGAGGRPGLAFHAGALLALQAHGYLAHEAASITGTSAGAIATAIVAAGGAVEDLVDYTSARAPRQEFRDMGDLIHAADRRRQRIDVTALGRPIELRGARRALSQLRAGRFAAAIAAVVPGVLEIRKRFTFLDVRADTVSAMPWRIVAAERSGARHVFTVGDAPLSLAVAASCAVPGVFAPVLHGGRTLVDGGSHSMTNADLAAADDSDIVIVVAPTCVETDAAADQVPAQARLDRELAELTANDKRFTMLRPSPALQRVMGRNPLMMRRCPEITAQAFDEVTALIAVTQSVGFGGGTSSESAVTCE